MRGLQRATGRSCGSAAPTVEGVHPRRWWGACEAVPDLGVHAGGLRTSRRGAVMSHSAEASPRGSARASGPDGEEVVAAAVHVSLARLYALRAVYLLIAIGLVVTEWPELVGHDEPGSTMDAVVTCMLVALSLLALVGVRHPLHMLPLLLFESAWKLLWFVFVAVPLWTAGEMDDATWEIAAACSLVVVVLPVVPWRYVWGRYVAAPGDRWR